MKLKYAICFISFQIPEESLKMEVTINSSDTCDREPYNITEEPTHAAIVTKGVFLAVCVALSFVCNTLCLIVLHKVRDRSLHKVTKIFMISFTLCDMFGIIFVYIPMTVATFLHSWPFGDAVCFINGFASTVFAYTSGIQLLSLNLERYLAISYPLKWYNVYVTPKRARITVVVLWISAMVFSTVAYSLPGRYTQHSAFLGVCTSNPCGHEPDISGTILSSSFFIAPVLLTLLLWLKTYLVAKRHSQAILAQVKAVNQGTLDRNQHTLERKYSQNSLGSLGSLDSPCRSPVQKEMDRKVSKVSLTLRSLGGTLDRRKASKASTAEVQVVNANRRAFFTFFFMSICMALISLPFIIVIVYDNTQRQMLSYGFVAVAEILIVSFGFLNVIIYYARNKAFRKTAKKLFCTPADPYSRPSKAFVTNTNGRSVGHNEGSARYGSRDDVTQADV